MSYSLLLSSPIVLEPRRKYISLMGKDPVHILSHLRQCVADLAYFVNSEVMNGVVLVITS